MPVEFCCPIHREPLDRSDPRAWIGTVHRERYPVIDGIPVLLPDRDERRRVAETDWDAPTTTQAAGEAVDFYNRGQFEHIYTSRQQDLARATIQAVLDAAPVKGPSLEIGSGKGALQGIGDEYVALDYSFTALKRNIDARFGRVCATADRLPFFDRSIGFLFTLDALEHVPEAGEAFAEIERVLVPGGTAYLIPAWHCVQYVCDGVSVRPYRDLNLRQKWAKLTLPIRRRPIVKAVGTLPARLARRAGYAIDRRPTRFRFGRLRAEYVHFWESDCDACSRLDAHEACLFFQSRGYSVIEPGSGAIRQILARHEPVVVRKPL